MTMVMPCSRVEPFEQLDDALAVGAVEVAGGLVGQHDVGPVRHRAPGTIPKASSGKRQCALCRELYLRDQLEPQRTGKRRLALVFARSGAGFLNLLTQRLLQGRREPD